MAKVTYTFREYPKYVTGPDGPIIVATAEAERALIAEASVRIAHDDEARSGTGHTAPLTHAAPWRPGLPVATKLDHDDWAVWKRERVLSLQRERRQRLRRIDYYPSRHVLPVIDRLTAQWGGSVGSTLDRIIAEWTAVPESNKGR
jgi:hypothetical protein